MKGSLHTDELLGAVVARETGLRTGRRISHVFIMDVPTYHKVLVTHRRRHQHCSGARGQGRHLPLNAIDLAYFTCRAAEAGHPRRGGDGHSKMPATTDAAALCKMADRGQIKGGVLDGPLAFDNAISSEAAKVKGIKSEVAGDPDIFLAPDLEAGNMPAKQLSFLANADSAGLVLGARVPIVLTSRADSVQGTDCQLRRRNAGGSCAAAAAGRAFDEKSRRDERISSLFSTPARRA